MTARPPDNARTEMKDLWDSLRRVALATVFVLIVFLAWAKAPWLIPYVGAGVASAFVFQVAVRPRLWEIVGVLAGGAGLVLLDQFLIHPTGKLDIHIGPCMGFVGLVSFLLLGLRATWAERGEKRQIITYILMPAAGFGLFVIGSQKLLNLGAMMTPKVMDVYAYAFDGSLGFQPSFMVGQYFRNHQVVGTIIARLYYAIPIALAIAYSAHLRQKSSPPLFVLKLFVVSGVLGYFLYVAFPAAGPAYLAGWEFPSHPVPFAQMRDLVLRGLEPRMVAMAPSIVRNAMPSLHMTWALLIAFNCRQFRHLRWLAYAYAVATVFGTLGTGEHYFVDLVVAFPFTVAMQALCTHSTPLKSPERLIPLAGGLLLTGSWLILLRFSIPFFFRWTPLVPWVCVMATIGGSVLWMKQILSVEQRQPQSRTLVARMAAGV